MKGWLADLVFEAGFAAITAVSKADDLRVKLDIEREEAEA